MENNGIGKLFEGVDRWTVLIYVLIVLVGFVAILSASYEEGAESIFSFSHFYMKQLVWMGISFAVAVVVLLVDASIYHKWAYLFYVLGLLTLVAALLFGREVNGAKAWFEIGSVRIQPVEFAKIATALALARVMSYEYLWHNIREVGGAYGTGMLSSDGVEYLYTYRDPHVKESYDTFAKGPAELAAREYTEKDLNDFIVGTVAKLDTPRKPRAEARETDRRYFCGITDEMMAADRKALCAVDAALLKEQAAELGAAMANGVRVVFGSKDAVEAAKEMFDTVETL